MDVKILRGVIAVLGWSALIIRQYTSCVYVNNCLKAYQFFTVQSNLFVTLWISLYFIWDEKRFEKLTGKIHGALTSYISLTFLVYSVVIAPIHTPERLEIYTSLVFHYLIPILFWVNFVLFERKLIEMKNIIYYSISYPLLYVGFVMILGFLTGDFVYGFFDIIQLGLVKWIFWVLGLLSLMLIISSGVIGVNHKLSRTIVDD
ncbi:MAG: Pr6Pr family membrane protein [Candidatus Heimdallarchaeota archaeon]|nr:Pr6Pr family membrane protein [Candidatus Heimdallarchaeota archaeon]